VAALAAVVMRVLAGVAMTARLSREVFGKALLNHLTGEHAQGRWYCEAERLGGLKIDQQLVLGWRLHGQLAGLSPRRTRSTYEAEQRVRLV
jgi:hypothetical protein